MRSEVLVMVVVTYQATLMRSEVLVMVVVTYQATINEI